MQQEPTLEQRVFSLERKIEELERFRIASEMRDTGLMQRADEILTELHTLQRDAGRGFIQQLSTQKDIQTRLENLEQAVAALVETGKGHKEVIEELVRNNDMRLAALEAGQQQILEILLGQTRLHD